MATAMQSCGKVFIVSVNLFLLVISIALIAAGFILRFGTGMFSSYIDPIIDDISKSSEGSLSNQVNGDEFDIAELFGPFATILLVIGFILLTVALLGIIGACCEVKCILAMYTVILGVIFIAQLIFVIMFFRYNSVLKDAARSPLKKLLTDYHGLNGTDVSSITLNFMMVKFGCCGIDGHLDFEDSDWFGGVAGTSASWKTPLACCKVLPSSSDFTCAETLDSNINNYDKGCLDEMWSAIFSMTDIYSIIGVVAVLLLQFMLLVFSIVLLLKKGKNAKVSPSKGTRDRNPHW